MNETKSSVLIAKRLLLALNELISSQNFEIDKKQILDDSKNLGNAIQTMLTRIDTAAVGLNLLKRLHLIPEQLKSSVNAINGDSTRDFEKVKLIVSNLLLDLDSIKQAKVSDSREGSASVIVGLAPVTVVKKKFSLPKSNTETTLNSTQLPVQPAEEPPKASQKEIVKDADAFKLPNRISDPITVKSAIAKDLPPIEVLQKVSDSKNMLRIEDKLNQVLESINAMSQASMDKKASLQLQSEAKSQLKKLSNLRTALYSTRRLTENILAEALGCLESGRSKIKSFQVGKPKDLEKSNLAKEIEDFEFFLETVKKDLVNGARPGPLYQEHIQSKLDELNAAFKKHSKSIITTKSEKKREWESALQTILDQQQQMTDSCNELNVLEKRLSSAKDLASSILPVIKIQQSKPLALKKPDIVVLEPEMIQEGMKNVLSELEMVKRTNENVEDLVSKIKKVRVTESNPFQAELEKFVQTGNLKDRGGFSMLEKKREQKLKELIYSLSL